MVNVLTLAERYFEEGKIVGEAKGEAKGEARGTVKGVVIGANKLAELIKSGLSLDDALRIINEEMYVAPGD